MADFVSHHLFGQQALVVFPAPAQRAAAAHPACYYWGCQGPDPLFFRKIALGSPLHKLGNRLHSEKTDELFAALAQGVQCLTDAAHEMAAAFFYGFLCHYALDSEVHPYVYYRQKQLCAVDARASASAVHSQIESDIDAALYMRQQGVPVTAFDPPAHYTMTVEEKAVLSCLMHVVISRVYGEDVPPRELRRACDEMLAWETFFCAGNRPLYRAADRLEQCIGRGPLATGHFKMDVPAWDAMNEDHAVWCNLWNMEELRTESVLDLFDQASIRAASLAGQYAAQFEAGVQVELSFPFAFDNGNPKKAAGYFAE